MATILDPFPRVRLASLPTPLEPLPRLSESLGGPRIFVKRDDQTGLALGGNKARKPEYLPGQADRLELLADIGVAFLSGGVGRGPACVVARPQSSARPAAGFLAPRPLDYS